MLFQAGSWTTRFLVTLKGKINFLPKILYHIGNYDLVQDGKIFPNLFFSCGLKPKQWLGVEE